MQTDPRFATQPQRRANREALTKLIEDFFSDITSAEVAALLDKAGIANGRMNEPIDVWNHVQFEARDKWRTIQTEAGPVRALLPPFTFTDQEAAMGDVPSVGQHTDEVLSEIGFTADRIACDADRGRGMTEFDPRAAPHGCRTTLVRRFPDRRAFRVAQPDHDRSRVPRLPGRQRRQPSDPLRRGVLQGARHAGAAGARAADRWRRPRPAPACSPYMTEDSLVGFIEQSSRFLKPVFAGDTIYPGAGNR